MSDARQAIRAAQEANAREHAPQNLQEAEGLMDQATRNLDRGAYEEARREAMAARERAIQARNLSLSKVGPLPTDFR
jgi:HEPN domain-containing protein